VLLDGSAIVAPLGTITLRVGDDLRGTGNRLIESGKAVDIEGDYLNEGPGLGSVIDLRGTILGTSLDFRTGDDDDGVSVSHVPAGVPLTVRPMAATMLSYWGRPRSPRPTAMAT
jgi:hypothetical protein